MDSFQIFIKYVRSESDKASEDENLDTFVNLIQMMTSILIKPVRLPSDMIDLIRPAYKAAINEFKSIIDDMEDPEESKEYIHKLYNKVEYLEVKHSESRIFS